MDEISDNIVQHTILYVLIVQTNFSRESDAILTERIEINAFIGILRLAGALQCKKHNLEEFLIFGILTETA
jgi:hypothetical protein